MAKKFSQFPSAASISPGDSVVGLKDGANTRFSFATVFSYMQSLFVPTARKVNNKALSSDITLDASDVGAVDAADVGVANGVASLDSNGKVPGTQLDLSGKQSTITASGILKGDGQGGVSAAVAGTDYGTYSKPSGGIPSTDMTSTVQTSLGKADTAYQKPSSGIPSSDMASGVQTSLGKADTAYQKPSGGIPASDLASGVIPSVPSAYTSDPAMDGTASPGSSGAWAKGDHVHPSDTSRVPVYGLGKNLLDNAYFVGGGSQLGDGVFPINQRGQTSYSGTGYGIDRWKQVWPGIQQVVRSDCLRMTAVSAVSTGNLVFCYFYCPKLPAGTYTLSFLVKEATGSGSWYYSSNASSGYGNVGNVKMLSGLVTKTFIATGNETSQSFYLWHQNALAVGDHLDIIAAKLECGSEQTLAHQENNAWVLNEIPDYGEELRKCQRYYFDTGANSTQGQVFIGLSNASGQVLSIMIPVPVSMNESNAMTITGIIGWVRGEGGAIGGYSLQSTTVLYKNAILIGVNASYGAMRTYGAYFTKLIFSAEQ